MNEVQQPSNRYQWFVQLPLVRIIIATLWLSVPLTIVQELIRLLHSTPAIYWDRTGFHELEGHVTFEEFVRRMIRKDKNNLSYLQEEFFLKKS